MSEALVQEPGQETSRKHPWLGIIGVVVGFVAVGLAVLSSDIVQALQRPKKEPADVIADAGTKLVDKIKGVKPAPVPPALEGISWPLVCSIAVTCLGIVAAGAGTAGWVRREDRRMAATAVAVGGVAIAWSYVLIAIVIAVVIFFLLMFLDLEAG